MNCISIFGYRGCHLENLNLHLLHVHKNTKKDVLVSSLLWEAIIELEVNTHYNKIIVYFIKHD
jgi:hypothetical protein